MTWWADLWIDAAGSLFADGVVPRHRSLQGDVEIEPGRVAIRHRSGVATLGVAAFPTEPFHLLMAAIGANPRVAGAVLTGTLPAEIHTLASQIPLELRPVGTQLSADCSCGSAVEPCRHVEALCHVVADLITDDPFLFFTLRGRARSEIVAAVRAARPSRPGPSPVGANPRSSAAASVDATEVFASNSRAGARRLPAPLPRLVAAGDPIRLASPPADAGIDVTALAALVRDASHRALGLLGGRTSALELSADADLARIAATARHDPVRLTELAASAGVNADELERRAIAFDVGGEAGLDALDARFDPGADVMADGHATLGAEARVRANLVVLKDRQLRVDEHGRWWLLLADDRLGWLLTAGPAHDPADLLAPPTAPLR